MELFFTVLASCILLGVSLRGIHDSEPSAGKAKTICLCSILIILSIFAVADHFLLRRQTDAVSFVTDLRLMTSALALSYLAGPLSLKKAEVVAGVTLGAMAVISLTWLVNDGCRLWLLYGYSAAALLAAALMHIRRQPRKSVAVEKKSPQTTATKQSEEEKMAALFERVEELMRKEKLYLEMDFSEDDLAKALYTNKAYLSRTINRMSGKNFCRYVNSYRVDYAIAVIRQNPRMKVTDLSMMSGFHTVVSFNMAFKLVTNCTPGEYQRTVQAERL